LVLKLKILDLKLPFYPCFTSVFSKSMQQFQKSVQPELKPVQPVSALFPSVTASLPVSPVRKSRVQIFGKTVQPIFGPAQPDLQQVQPNFGPAQPNLSPVQSPAESASEPKTPWWNPVQPVLEPVQPFFSHISLTATSFWGHLYIHLPHSSPQKSMHKKLHSQPEKHLPLSLAHLLPLPFQIFGEKSFSEIEELWFWCFISKSFLLFLIRALVLHRVLCGFITLGDSSS
jgi:hypothetical protein